MEKQNWAVHSSSPFYPDSAFFLALAPFAFASISSIQVVIKALMIFHRIFRDGDPAFMEAMKPRSNLIFALRTFSSLAPPSRTSPIFVLTSSSLSFL